MADPFLIKICGIKSTAILDAAIEAGADMVGFVHFARSPRHIELDPIGELISLARGRAETCVLLVNPDNTLVAQVAALGPDWIQLHGPETPHRVEAIRDAAGIAILKACPIGSADDVAAVGTYAECADRLLLDAKAPTEATRPGGLGTTFDWTLLKALDPGLELHAFRGPDARQCGRGHQRRAPHGRRCVFGCRERAGRQGCRPDPRLHHQCAVRCAELRAMTEIDGEPSRANSLKTGPDEDGRFGIFGGRFVAETLMPLIRDLETAYLTAKDDPAFVAEMADLRTHYAGRPSPLYFAERLTAELGGAKVYLKREELNHTGSHKINNYARPDSPRQADGQDADHRRDRRGPARRGDRHRVRQIRPALRRLHGRDRRRAAMAECAAHADARRRGRPVTAGAGTLKDAMNEALRDWVTNVESTYYLIGTAAGPHPYPMMVRDFQKVIGEEIRTQMQEAEGRLPDALVACVGGGSNAIGTFYDFLDEPSVRLYGAEAGGHGLEVENGHAASMTGGTPGVLHGNRTYLLQDADGQILEGHSISAGLDYPGVGPEHAWLHDKKRVTYVPITDKEALEAFQLLTRVEGIIPALESAHGLAQVMKLAPDHG